MSNVKVTQTQSTAGISGMVLLTIVFVILKAMGYLEWSWLWVFAPLWIPPLIGVIFLAVAFVIYFIYEMNKR